MKTAAFAAALVLSSVAMPFAAAASQSDALKDASAILAAEGTESERPAYSPGHGVKFKPSDHVFVKSALTEAFLQCDIDAGIGCEPISKNIRQVFFQRSCI